MPVVGFGFDNINIEKKQPFDKDDKINNNIKIIELKETSLKPNDKDELPGILILFEFSLSFAKAGNLSLKGHIIYYDPENKTKELLKNWKDGKKLPAQFSTQIFNFILYKCNIRALQLEEEVGLPLHLKLPKFKVQNQKKD